jgi:TonB family protein
VADAVSNVLDHRLGEVGRGRLGRALLVALVAHTAGVAAALWLPGLLRRPAELPRFVAVQIVPAARLGVTAPPVAAPPKAKPEPVPAPAPKAEAPVLPDRKAKVEKPAARPEPRPEAAAPRPQTAEPSPPEGTATGSTTGTLAFGAAVAGFDNPNFTYGYYVDQMLSKISSNWARPPVGSGVEAILYFRIQRDGRIDDLRIAHSSGYNGFDLAALRAVQASSPLPPLPRAFREDSLGVNLIVR